MVDFPIQTAARLSCWLAILATLLGGVASATDPISFSRQIQPIFAEHCLQCHGPEAEQREADLQLDAEASAKETAIVAGAPDESELIVRVTSDDPELRMPPETSALSDADIDLLRRWIESGAPYEQHWAFRPIQAPPIPEVQDSQGFSEIDKFVIAKLRERQLNYSQPATKQQLIRRATFDLTGLPPTWEEVTQFLADDSADAFQKVIERLLDSPAYGERWGRHWLDLARYADTHGGAAIGFKRFAFSYTYRDYVIQAFNQDLSYDQFVTEQLAADQLGLTETAKELAALGFLTVGMQFRNPHNTIDDQIDVVTRGLMGLTVSCARCHDHKFDAVTTKDYYSLYATFAPSRRPEALPIISKPESSAEREQYDKERAQFVTSYTDMARDQSEILRGRLRMQVGLYLREIAENAPEPDLAAADVFSYRTEDLRPHVLARWQKYLAAMSADDPVFGPWVQLETCRDPAQDSARGAEEPNSDSTDFAGCCQALLANLMTENAEVKEPHRLSAEAPRWNPRVLAALTARKPQSMLDVADAYGELFAEVHREWLQALLDTSLEARPGNVPVPDEDAQHLVANSAVQRQLRRHLYGPNSPIMIEDPLASRLLNRPINDNVSGRRGTIHNLDLTSPGSPARAMVLSEQAEAGPYHVFDRGNPLHRGELVSPRFLSALGGGDKQFRPGRRRLDLAHAIVDPGNPLTRRVVVNWVWQHHFGRGLVRTPDDFGTRGDPPTHPQLLDYLATKLLEDGWSLKQLHRRIMLSAVYQQASLERPAARKADPDNQLWWRMPRRRLELEAMRDAMLFASGELCDQSGGRPFDLLSDPVVPRRSVYAFVNRDIVNPLRSTFDAANPNACTAKRPETTVPQQTLFALNSNFIQDRAERLAVLITQDSPSKETQSDAELIRALYRRTLSREPDETELTLARAYIDKLDADDKKLPWQRLAHVLLAANEFVFVD